MHDMGQIFLLYLTEIWDREGRTVHTIPAAFLKNWGGM